MKKNPQQLIVVAHPDDETIFFSGLILSQPKATWKIICVTDGNADGRGGERRKEFSKACLTLGVKDFEHWDFPDEFEAHLDIITLSQRLSMLPKPKRVFTHGPFGEYGHRHHRDVAHAVRKAFPRSDLWHVAYNQYPQLLVKLSEKHYNLKCKILRTIYGREIERFIHLLPATFAEGFVQMNNAQFNKISGLYQSDLSLAKSWPEYLVFTQKKNQGRLF